MKRYLFWVQNFLSHNGELLNITILKLGFYQGRVIKARDKVLGTISTLPIIYSNNLFSLIIYIVNWSFFCLTLIKVKCSKHRNGTQIQVVNLIVIIFRIEKKVGLSNSLSLHINYVVVIHYTILVQWLLLCFVCYTH